MANFDFGSDIPNDLPVTKRVSEEVNAAARANTGINGFRVQGLTSQALFNGLADLEARLNAIEAREPAE
ncbi:hypothetical protein [Rhodococcus jostii]|uniref:hypothetical protein n=1 Tax=Rhodococcus jostii TaxID=132919 RepID=UPI00363E1E6D